MDKDFDEMLQFTNGLTGKLDVDDLICTIGVAVIARACLAGVSIFKKICVFSVKL